MQSTTFRTVAELSRALAAREVSAVELAQDYLARIEAHKELNCFLDVRPEVTLEPVSYTHLTLPTNSLV